MEIFVFAAPQKTLKFNALLNTWTEGSPMPVEVQRPTAVAHGNKAFVLNTDVFQEYVMDQDSWTVLLAPTVSCKHAAMMCYKGYVMVSGGYEQDYNHPSHDIQKYNISDGSWESEAFTLPKCLRLHNTFVLAFPLEKN